MIDRRQQEGNLAAEDYPSLKAAQLRYPSTTLRTSSAKIQAQEILKIGTDGSDQLGNPWLNASLG